MPRAAATHLRLVSDAHVSRHLTQAPDLDTAFHLLGEANARAPAGAPMVPGRRKLWLYGPDEITRPALAFLEAVGQPVAGILVDRAADGVAHPRHGDIPVLGAEDAPPETKAAALVAICTLTMPFAPIEAELNRVGWSHCVPLHDVTAFFREQQPFGDGWFAPRLDPAEMEAAGAVLAGFGDAASRAHYLRFAAWRLARQEWDFSDAPVEPDTCFFIPEVTRAFKPTERVLDAGAHDGRVIAQFLKRTGTSVSTIWAVEPDAANRAHLQARVDRFDIDLRARTQILDAVLGAGAEAVRFHGGLGPCSRIAASGSRLRAAVPLDALAIDPTFVNLDLEGAELNALAGARQTLLKHRPIIAVTTHHSADGLIATPSWLMRELPDYTVLMRTHGWCGTGAVLYAIPKERSAP